MTDPAWATNPSIREELLQLLLQQGILYRSRSQPILSRDGASARWMLDSLAVTLVPRGAELSGRCILELLKRFEGRQLATYGLTAVPILESCILQSGGRYHGLLVRKERKTSGSLKLIEGPVDPAEPTILVDDSISSGTSIEDGCQRLEAAGLRVEGAVCLVRFGWYSGYARMQERGYHVEAVFDIYEDFMAKMQGEPRPLPNPSKWFPEFEWSAERAPEGLHPAQLARLVLREYFTSGRLLGPPERLDAGYDASGGAWVSIRSKKNIYRRYARDGFWHFPGETQWPAPEAVVRATLRTATHLPASRGKKLVERSHIAVTFFSALEECTVGQLDNDRYGIVVCSRERPGRMGGALPRMPGIGGEWEQFQHAGRNNGKLLSFEPFGVYRHHVVKAVEPGAPWQPAGVPAERNAGWDGSRAAERARDIVISHLFGAKPKTSPLPDDLFPAGLDSLYICIYFSGRIRGCMGSSIQKLDRDVERLAIAALRDDRFDDIPVPDKRGEVAVSVSLLYNRLDMGSLSPKEAARSVRLGNQALMAWQKRRAGMLLPFVAATQNLDRQGFAAGVIEKAGIRRPPYYWARFDCTTWLAEQGGVARLEGGFKVAPPPSSLEEALPRLAALHAAYLIRYQQPDGSLFLRYEPFQNVVYQGTCAPRQAHGAWVLARAYRVLGGPALRNAARKTVAHHRRFLHAAENGLWLEEGHDPPSISELAFLLLALCELSQKKEAGRLAVTLWSSIDSHGRFITHRPPAESPDAFQDYCPGQALLALAAASRAGVTEVQEYKLARAFCYYRHRFRYKRSFGPVSWLMQAFGEWWQVNCNPEYADFVFEIGDWILQYQQDKTGAFINDHQPDTPGYTTAVYLEGVAAGARLAGEAGDVDRYNKYLESLRRGFRFLDRLVIQQRDRGVLPNLEYATGGVRRSLYSSEIRTDFVQHSLSAILEVHPKVFSWRPQ